MSGATANDFGSITTALQIQPISDQSIFVRSAISGVVREAIIAACLTAAMILVFLGSWRSTVIVRYRSRYR